MDERQIIELCDSVRFISADERPAAGENRLWPVALGQDAEEGCYARFWTPAAFRTLRQVLPGPAGESWPSRVSSWRIHLGRMRHALRLAASLCRAAGCFPADTVLIRRSQKVILLNRRAGWAIHMLRNDMEPSRLLLQNEIVASRLLPEWTLPVQMSHLDAPPFFIMQPYLPYSGPENWRQLLPEMARIVAALFRFYSASGLRHVPAAAYLDELSSGLRTVVGRQKEEAGATRLEFLLGELRAIGLKMTRESPLNDVLLARTHGDFIAAHVVRPRGSTGRYGLLVDWSESHVYSVFHDLFYFHFQNHQSDFCDRFLQLTEDEWREYYGEGVSLLRGLLARETGVRLEMADVRFNFILGFLQELEHRLYRLHPRFIPFWIRQAERALRSCHGT